MSESLSLSLQITLVGMGIVFGAILLLWLMMALLVRLTAESQSPADAAANNPVEPVKDASLDNDSARRRAAAAVVAYALAAQVARDEPHEFPLPPTAVVSAWQAVMRTRMHNKRGPTR